MRTYVWWKVFSSLIVVATLILFGSNIIHSGELLGPPYYGRVDGAFTPEATLFSRRSIVRALAPSDDLSNAGVVAGDVIQWQPYYSYRSRLPGETVRLRVLHERQWREVTVTTTERAVQRSAFAWFTVVVGVVCLGLGVLVAWRRPDSKACRALAIYLLFIPAFSVIWVTSPGSDKPIDDTVWWMSSVPYWVAQFAFALNFHQEAASTKLSASRFKWLFALLLVISSTGVVCDAYNVFVPFLDGGVALVCLGQSALILWALVESWHRAGGEERKRRVWLIAGFALPVVTAQIAWLTYGFASSAVNDVANWVVNISYIVSNGMLVYAVLRHRVIDFGFVVNKALVYSGISTIVLTLFGVFEWLTDHILAFGSREGSAVVDGAIAVGIYLVVHHFHHSVEHRISRIFFRDVPDTTQRLQDLIDASWRFGSPSSLLNALSEELHHADMPDTSLYVRNDLGKLETVHPTGERQSPTFLSREWEAIAVARGESATSPLFEPPPSEGVPKGALCLPIWLGAKLMAVLYLGPQSSTIRTRPSEIKLWVDVVRAVAWNLKSFEEPSAERVA